MASQSGLGREARILARAAGGGEPRGGRVHGRPAGGGRDPRQRVRRPARRRLCARRADDRRGGRGLPRLAGRHPFRHERRAGERADDELRRRGARDRAGGRHGRHSVRHLVHGRDGREAPERAAAARSRRAGRRGVGRRPRLLHDQLRPPDALRGRPRGGRGVEGADPRPPCQRVEDEPRRAR